MPLILLFIQYSFIAQHVSAVNTTIFRSLRLTGCYFMGGICILSIFRNTNIKIAYKCRNTIANLTKPHRDLHNPPHNKWGIYQLTCNACNLSYVGQTSHSLNIRFQEHIRYNRYNNPQSPYAYHILQNQHEYGPMNSTMTLLKPLNNPSLLLPYEQYYIQSLCLLDRASSL